jgi:hypothetical protein
MEILNVLDDESKYWKSISNVTVELENTEENNCNLSNLEEQLTI